MNKTNVRETKSEPVTNSIINNMEKQHFKTKLYISGVV